jgi:hypothetical protein
MNSILHYGAIPSSTMTNDSILWYTTLAPGSYNHDIISYAHNTVCSVLSAVNTYTVYVQIYTSTFHSVSLSLGYKITVFWDLTPCSLVYRHQYFAVMCPFQRQDRTLTFPQNVGNNRSTIRNHTPEGNLAAFNSSDYTLFRDRTISVRSQWLRGLSDEMSSPARTLGSWFRTRSKNGRTSAYFLCLRCLV